MISELEIEFNFVSCLTVYGFPCPYSNDSFTDLIDNNSFIIQYFNMLLFYLPASKSPRFANGKAQQTSGFCPEMARDTN